ncbi:MAG TPA: DUF2264 domain-containing protein [Actinospica sp.]|jgi:hypothetical protein|nr:DUF2264 domain-containing protein [Actinospica sp.]
MSGAISPYTGWTRSDWTALADRMLLAARKHASPSHALITPPGAPGGYGTRVDGLEGFARTFLLAGFRLAGEGGRDPLGLLPRYAEGLAAGTDPGSPERWVTPSEHGQAKVEAAAIALILDLTRPWLWDRLDPAVQERVVAYLAQVVGDHEYPRTNWVWFRIVVEQFLASVSGPWSLEDMQSDLAVHESFVRENGWYSDGEERSYDHYCGWALHVYPILWSRMAGASDLAAPLLRGYTERLDRFLLDAVRLIGADGSPLIQGRSLVYRFAAAAPFWIGAMTGTSAVDPGLLRRAASGVVKHFTDHGVPDDDGLLTLGWHRPWRRMAQRYSGPGSPYWAAKGMLGLALPEDHPVWTSTEQPLPVETADQLAVVAAPGWVLSSTQADGVVRVYNHGTDHARPGDRIGDSPLYARLGYSTATSPQLDTDGWDAPLDQSVVLLDAAGRATHRTGFRTIDVREEDGVGVLASQARCHWIDPDRTAPDHGSGRPGTALDAGLVTTVSIVRGPWEVRCVRVEPADAPGWNDVVALRIGGWPVSAAEPPSEDVDALSARVHGPLTSAIVALGESDSGFTSAGVHRAEDATPLGPHTATPWLQADPHQQPRTWLIAAISLGGDRTPPHVAVTESQSTTTFAVAWPDGARTEHSAPLPSV